MPGNQAGTEIPERVTSSEAAPEHGRVPAAPAPGSRSSKAWSRVLANGVPLLILVAWWVVAQRTPEFILPQPLAVGRETLSLLFGAKAVHTYTSFLRVIIAVVLALGIGGVLVFVATLVPVTDRLVGDRILPTLNSIPSLGWAILGVIWFGVSNASVIFVETAILIPFCMVNLWEGSRAIDSDLLEMGRSFSRNKLQVLFRIEIPLLLPYVFAAVRLSFSVGWKVALIAEFFGATQGLGLVMNRARQNFDTPALFATIVTVLVIVFVVERLIFERLGQSFALRTGTGAS